MLAARCDAFFFDCAVAVREIEARAEDANQKFFLISSQIEILNTRKNRRKTRICARSAATTTTVKDEKSYTSRIFVVKVNLQRCVWLPTKIQAASICGQDDVDNNKRGRQENQETSGAHARARK